MSIEAIAQKLFSECGMISVMFSVAIVWLCAQLASERKGREADRTIALQTIEKYSKAYENVVISNSKIEGILAGKTLGGGE